FKPARFITIMYRLFEMQDKKKGNFYRLAIKPKVFQRSIKKSKNNKFVAFIKEILNVDKKKSNKPSLLATVKDLLTYEERTNKYGLPFITVSRLNTQSPEVLFMLMYRLHIAEDGFCLQSDEHRKLLGIITLFSWLGKGEQRDHSQLLRNIFPTMIKLNPNRFWSWETVQRALLKHNGKEVLTHFPLIEKLKKEIRTIIKNNNGNYKSGIFEKINNEVYSFIGKIFWNKDLLTYSQRNYLSKEYENKYFMLDDTNVPFDWDHIFPHDFIRNKRGITQSLKDWYHSNGNFWACPYEFNRGAHDDPPCEKFKDKGWLDENCLKAASIDKEALENCNKIIDKDSLKENWKTVYEFILNRNLNLCEEWYDQFEIDKLIPESLENEDIKKLFENIIKMMWKEIEEEGWQTYNLSIGENNLSLYFSYNTEDDTLEEDGIEFGIYSEEDSGSKIIKNIKISKELENKYIQYKNKTETGMYTNFTLISYSENSMIDLFKSFNDWLKKFPDNNIKKMATERFHDSIRVQYKKKILNKN
ncbi:MAG: hypothetical protein U9R02_04760, partial [Thermodesulfobacteriota bacterium]|nr:hypothetical protein [Thermodesulfobacteriota bacterium]